MCYIYVFHLFMEAADLFVVTYRLLGSGRLTASEYSNTETTIRYSSRYEAKPSVVSVHPLITQA